MFGNRHVKRTRPQLEIGIRSGPTVTALIPIELVAWARSEGEAKDADGVPVRRCSPGPSRGLSIREIARTFSHSRKKVRQILAEGQPRPMRGLSRLRCSAPSTASSIRFLPRTRRHPPSNATPHPRSIAACATSMATTAATSDLCITSLMPRTRSELLPPPASDGRRTASPPSI